MSCKTGSSGLVFVLETQKRQEDQQRDMAKSSQERLPDPLPLRGFYSTTMKSAFCLTLVRKTTSRACGTGEVCSVVQQEGLSLR